MERLDNVAGRRIAERIDWLAANLESVRPEPLTGALSGPLMELREFLNKAVGQARQEAHLPPPAVEGASNGDGWVWRWIVSEGEQDKREPYRGEVVLVFRPDAFGEKVLTQLVGTAWSVTQPNAAWNQSYPVPHLSRADMNATTVDAMKFTGQLTAQLRICWSDVQQNGPRLRLVAQHRQGAVQELRKRGIKIR